MTQQIMCVDCKAMVDLDSDEEACNCLDGEPRCPTCRESFDQFCAQEDCYETSIFNGDRYGWN